MTKSICAHTQYLICFAFVAEARRAPAGAMARGTRHTASGARRVGRRGGGERELATEEVVCVPSE